MKVEDGLWQWFSDISSRRYYFSLERNEFFKNQQNRRVGKKRRRNFSTTFEMASKLKQPHQGGNIRSTFWKGHLCHPPLHKRAGKQFHCLISYATLSKSDCLPASICFSVNWGYYYSKTLWIGSIVSTVYELSYAILIELLIIYLALTHRTTVWNQNLVTAGTSHGNTGTQSWDSSRK